MARSIDGLRRDGENEMDLADTGIRDLAADGRQALLPPDLAQRLVDAAPLALFMLAGDGALRYANEQGRRELDGQCCVRLAGSRLAPADPAYQGRWCRALRGIDRLQSDSFRIAGRPEERFASIRRESRCTGGSDWSDDIVLMVTLDRGQSDRCAAFERWRTMHGLTPAEARTVLELVRGDSAIEVANRSGVAVSTIRTQIRSACAKVDCSSSRALVASMLRFGLGPM